MKTLRQIHLYLGCFFAPLLVFFAISGTWQVSRAHYGTDTNPAPRLALLSTLHTGRSLKSGERATLSSPAMRWLVRAMAAALVVTIVLGVWMAFRFGHGAIALGCFGGGVAIPAAFVARQLFAG